jgi:holliday junction DNA helicase RuvA
MIGYVRGIVTHLFKESCYVDVHGVGYRVYVPTTTRQQLTEDHEATLRCNATLRLLDGRRI